jgi:HlyD family secretion protein
MSNQQLVLQARGGGMARKLAIVAGLASLAMAGLAIALVLTPGARIQIRMTPSEQAPAATSTAPPASVSTGGQQAWTAAAPGRVEPKSGQIKLSTSLTGRVESVAVAINDRVAEGEVLVRLEDKEARARLSAAEAEAAARKRERDAQPVTSGRESVSKAEDALFSAERAVNSARLELDDAIAANRRRDGSAGAVNSARRRLTDANEKLRTEQANFASAHAKSSVPAPNRLEAALIAARSEVTLAESLLDKTRIRAPIAAKVLQINAKVGELVAPSPELPLVVVGDMSVVRVRAEVDEADVAKIKLGQSAFVRTNAYPGRDFEGKVVEIAPSLALPKMGSRGARRATDVEVMEVVIDLDGNVPLLPGMRTDAFFRR